MELKGGCEGSALRCIRAGNPFTFSSKLDEEWGELHGFWGTKEVKGLNREGRTNNKKKGENSGILMGHAQPTKANTQGGREQKVNPDGGKERIRRGGGGLLGRVVEKKKQGASPGKNVKGSRGKKKELSSFNQGPCPGGDQTGLCIRKRALEDLSATTKKMQYRAVRNGGSQTTKGGELFESHGEKRKYLSSLEEGTKG